MSISQLEKNNVLLKKILEAPLGQVVTVLGENLNCKINLDLIEQNTPKPGTEFERKIVVSADEIWSVLGKTWALLILKKLTESESIRFNEIKKAIPMISNTVLSERLRDLEEHGLIVKKIYAQVPARVEYSITKQTQELGKILKQLDNWVALRRKEKSKIDLHEHVSKQRIVKAKRKT